MKIEYRFFEPDQGLEEIQTDIYNANTGFEAPAEMMIERYKKENTDPKLVRYAFTKDGQPLAYVQARAGKEGLFSIGYPWTTPECPTEVQHKIFDELLNYIKEEKNPQELRYWLHDDWKTQIEFFKAKGFEISGRDEPGVYMSIKY